MSSFLCFVCHSTVNADTNEDTREKYREVIGMNLCPDSHLCFICCYFLNKMCLFKSICLKRSLEYPVLFSEKGTINLQRSDITVSILCPEDICLQHLNTRYHFYNNNENSQSDDGNYCELQDERNFINNDLVNSEPMEEFHHDDYLFSTKDNVENLFNEELMQPNYEPVRIIQNDLVNGEWTKNDSRINKTCESMLLELHNCNEIVFETNMPNVCTEMQKLDEDKLDNSLINVGIILNENIQNNLYKNVRNNMNENVQNNMNGNVVIHMNESVTSDINKSVGVNVNEQINENVQNNMNENVENNVNEHIGNKINENNFSENIVKHNNVSDNVENSLNENVENNTNGNVENDITEHVVENDINEITENNIQHVETNIKLDEEDDSESVTETDNLETETYNTQVKEFKRKAKRCKKKDFEKVELSVKEQKMELAQARREEKYAEGFFKCHSCALSYHFKDTYQAHMMRHEESNGEYRCSICALRFASPAVHRKHTANHSFRYRCTRCSELVRARQRPTHARVCLGREGDSISCHLCGGVFQSPESLQQHLKRYHHQEKARNRSYLCSVCGKNCQTRGAVRTHMLTHINRKFSCDQCTSTFSSPYTLSQHKKKHTAVDQELNYCATCKVGYKTRKSLLAHFRNSMAHKDTVYSCPVCARASPTRRAAAAHAAAVHARPAHLACGLCTNAYSTRKALVTHMTGHKNEATKKTPLCHACGGKFKSTSILKRHLKNVCEKNKTEEELNFFEQ